ncbi:DUF1641 domain-containing protein [Shouchella patagoniensis]|uniref:DUF1641 domain-containing protein n=1 Tax=Shouchella patagoniensis TaxID=228576 RepID=UPI000995AC25|nr:DUF1641 domain-containing protein [Shouchella patagoniensis]
MAKATTIIQKMPVDPDVKREQDIQEIKDALVHNKKAILATLALLQKVQDTEAFNIADASISQREQLVDRLVKQLDDPNITQSIQNLLLLGGALGSVKLADLEPMIFKMNSAIHKVAEYEHKGKGGYVSLVRSLKDPETIEGLNTMVAFVKGFGVDQSKNEMNQPQYELTTLAQGQPKEKEEEVNRKQESRQTTKWYVIAAGALAFVLPLIFNRK